MTGEVNDLIQALREESMTLAEVAQRFRERSWPPSKSQEPTSQQEWKSSILQDPGPRVPDSFDDVSAAYYRGEITETQYQVLADAVADAIGRSPNPNEWQ